MTIEGASNNMAARADNNMPAGSWCVSVDSVRRTKSARNNRSRRPGETEAGHEADPWS